MESITLRTRCSSGNDITKTCVSAYCTSPAFMCNDSRCPCVLLHSKCFVSSEIEAILESLQRKTSSLKPIYQKIGKFMSGMIKTITVYKDELFKRYDTVESESLEPHEFMFFSLYKQEKTTEIFPQMTLAVIKSLKLRPEADYEKISKEINVLLETKKNQFLESLKQINNSLNCQIQMKRLKDRLRSYEIQTLKVGDNTLDPDSNFELSSLTSLHLGSVNTPSIKGLTRFCPRLDHLCINGNPMKPVPISDECVDALRFGLQNLSILSIYNSTLTDKQATLLSQSMRSTTRLELGESSITREARDNILKSNSNVVFKL